MFNQQTFKFDCAHLLDEIEMIYQDLCDALGLAYEGTNRQLMRSALAYLLEDTINKLTDPRFHDQEDLTKNLISHYLEYTVKLDNFDKEDIDKIFVQPLMSDTAVLLGNLFKKFNRYYSKWEVRESDQFPVMEIEYQGDFRIMEWHRIQDVPSRAPVAIKRHRIRFEEMADIINYALRNVPDVAVSDVAMLIEDIMRYYVGKQVDELYKEIVIRLKTINGFRENGDSSKALRQAKSIIKGIESIPSFVRFKEDASVAEAIYTERTGTRVNFDVVMPSKYTNHNEARQSILDEIDQMGYVVGDIAGKVEIIYG